MASMTPTSLRPVDLIPTGPVPVEKGLETTSRPDEPHSLSSLSAAGGGGWRRRGQIRGSPSAAVSYQTLLPPAQGRWRARIRSTKPTDRRAGGEPATGRSGTVRPCSASETPVAVDLARIGVSGYDRSIAWTGPKPLMRKE